MILRNLSLFVALCSLTVANISIAEAVPNSNDLRDRPETQNVSDRRRDGNNRFMERLDLSEEQKNQIAQIREKYRQRFRPLRERSQSLRQELQTMLNGNASDSQIRAKHRELLSVRQELANLRFESTLEMRNVMTLEQRREFAELMEERRQRYRRGDRRRTSQ